jgi:hypothetical protein
MKKACVIVLLAVLAGGALAAAEAAKPRKASTAILFNFFDLVSAVLPYDDGFQAGAGMKLRLGDKLAGRAMLSASVDTDLAGSTLKFGASAGCEYHLVVGKASPYLGGFLGGRYIKDPTGGYLDGYVGAVGGVELEVLSNVSVAGEYQALVGLSADVLSLHLGDKAVLSIAIYF